MGNRLKNAMKEESPQLLPCPFCGGKAVILISSCTYLSHAECLMCEAKTTERRGVKRAASHWNKRVSDK